MMGMRVETTGRGVPTPRKMRESSTLKAGSRVFTVCVSEMATAAKDRLAATWPTACMAAGPKMVLNSSLLMGCKVTSNFSELACHCVTSASSQCETHVHGPKRRKDVLQSCLLVAWKNHDYPVRTYMTMPAATWTERPAPEDAL